MCLLSWNLGASTSWNSQGLSRPVMGLLYPFYYVTNWCLEGSCLHLHSYVLKMKIKYFSETSYKFAQNIRCYSAKVPLESQVQWTPRQYLQYQTLQVAGWHVLQQLTCMRIKTDTLIEAEFWSSAFWDIHIGSTLPSTENNQFNTTLIFQGYFRVISCFFFRNPTGKPNIQADICCSVIPC